LIESIVLTWALLTVGIIFVGVTYRDVRKRLQGRPHAVLRLIL